MTYKTALFEIMTDLDEIRKKRNLLYDAAEKKIDVFVGTVLLSEKHSENVAVHLRRAHEKGAKIRLLFHLTPENIDIVLKYFSFGIMLKHSPLKRYHLRIIDDNRVMVELLSTEGGGKSRIALVSLDEICTNHFIQIFNEMWEEGITVEKWRKAIMGFY